MSFVLLVGNCYRKASDGDRAAQRKIIAAHAPDAALMCEAQQLGDVDGYQRFAGPRGHSAEVAVYIPADKHVTAKTEQVSDDAGGRAVWHCRFVQVVLDEDAARVYVAIHFPADVKDHGRPDRSSAGWREWVKAMRAVASICRLAQERGFRVYVGGDFNYFEGSRTRRIALTYWSPTRTFRRLGMTYSSRGLIGVAMPRDVRILAAKVIRPAVTGSDHPWTVYSIKETR